MNVKELPISLVTDIKRDYTRYPTNHYYNYAPFNSDRNGKYPEINLKKRHSMCYIKLKNKDLFLYEDENRNLAFKPLHRTKMGFAIKKPMIVWIEYIGGPLFIIYKPHGYGLREMSLLKFSNNTISWSENIYDATVFYYKETTLLEYLYEDKEWNEMLIKFVNKHFMKNINSFYFNKT